MVDTTILRANDIESVIRGRRSVRHFRAGVIPREVILRAIEAAGWAPSPHGTQPWRFSIVESSERRDALADAMAATWREQLSLDGEDRLIVELRLEKSRERMLSATLLIIPCLYLGDADAYPDPDRQESERLMAVQSIGSAIQNLQLSLYASGLDSGWMCAPIFCPEVVRDALGLPEAMIPQAMIPVGYAVKEPIRKPRRPVEELIIDWE
ncbi:nitroreductase family protein [soil metagenome]